MGDEASGRVVLMYSCRAESHGECWEGMRASGCSLLSTVPGILLNVGSAQLQW